MIGRAAADGIVRVIVEQMTPRGAKESRRILQQIRSERAERLGPQAQLILALRIALLQMNPAGIHARNQPLLILRARIAPRLAQLPLDRLIDLPAIPNQLLLISIKVAVDDADFPLVRRQLLVRPRDDLTDARLNLNVIAT